MAVWFIRPSIEDARPQIPFSFEPNANIDWLCIGQILDDNRPVSEFPSNVSVFVPSVEATQWDFYMDGGARGLLSQRFVDVVGSHALRYFQLLPAKLNEATYYFLRVAQSVECLDKTKSIIQEFEGEPGSIMDIEHYEFIDTKIPDDALFCITGAPWLYGVEKTVVRIRKEKLRGVSIEALP